MRKKVIEGRGPCDDATSSRSSAALAATWPLAARAQGAAYPNRPITLIVPYAPGGGNDVLARGVAEPMGKTLGQQIVIENHGGAGGSLGTRQVAKSAPDGYTLGLGGTGTLAIDPTLYPNVGYDPRKDFAPVGLIATSPLIILVNPSLPAHNVQELIALAKAQPGKLNYASAGKGSGIHLGTVLFAENAGIELTHIPYKGSGPALTDLLGNHVSIYFSSLPPAIGLVKEGKLRALGVTGLKRSPIFPDVPTVAEQGLPGFEAVLHYGIVAPAGTPRADHRQAQQGAARGARFARGAQAHRHRRRRATADHAGRIRRRHRPRGDQVVGAGEKVGRQREVTTYSAPPALEFVENLVIVLAERRRRRIDARAAMREREGGERHAEAALDAGCRFHGDGRCRGSQAADRRAPRPWCARARPARDCACRKASHSSAVRVSMISSSSRDLARVIGVALVVGLLDHVGAPEQRPQPRAAGADCWRPASPARPWWRRRRWSRADGGCRCGLGCTPLRR